MNIIHADSNNTLDINDRGLLYGDGVWETVAVRSGRPQLLDLHMDRLHQGVEALAISNVDLERVRQQMMMVSEGQERAVLKVLLTRGCGQRGYDPATATTPTVILQLSPRNPQLDSHAQHGVVLGVCSLRLGHQPLLAGLKHLNRLEQVLARRQFASDWQEGLLLDQHAHVVEGTMSNLFILTEDGEVLTPVLSLCGVAGVMRRHVLMQLAQMGIRHAVLPLDLGDIERARALFLTNALIGVWPVRKFQERILPIPILVRHLQQRVESVL